MGPRRYRSRGCAKDVVLGWARDRTSAAGPRVVPRPRRGARHGAVVERRQLVRRRHPGRAGRRGAVLAGPRAAGAAAAVRLPPPAAAGTGNRTPWIVGVSLLVLVAVVGRRSSSAAPRASAGGATPVAAPADPAARPGPLPAGHGPDHRRGRRHLLSVPGRGLVRVGRSGSRRRPNRGPVLHHPGGHPGRRDVHRAVHLGAAADGFGWAGPSTLQTTLAAVADASAATTTRRPNERKVMRDEDAHGRRSRRPALRVPALLGRPRLRRQRRAGGAAADRRRPAGPRAAVHLDPEHARRALRRPSTASSSRRRA